MRVIAFNNLGRRCAAGFQDLKHSLDTLFTHQRVGRGADDSEPPMAAVHEQVSQRMTALRVITADRRHSYPAGEAVIEHDWNARLLQFRDAAFRGPSGHDGSADREVGGG